MKIEQFNLNGKQYTIKKELTDYLYYIDNVKVSYPALIASLDSQLHYDSEASLAFYHATKKYN